MHLINLFGGPGSGKSTTSALLFGELKMSGIRAELVGEEAREKTYDNAQSYFDNQVLILGLQYQRIRRLEVHKCDVAIADSPLIQGLMYSQNLHYYNELKALVHALENQFPNTYNVFINRVKPYTNFGRNQNEEGARELDMIARSLTGNSFWLEVNGDRDGAVVLTNKVKELLNV
jgi:tRNA uridine 5-carbamoylmethylation protein Kti12